MHFKSQFLSNLKRMQLISEILFCNSYRFLPNSILILVLEGFTISYRTFLPKSAEELIFFITKFFRLRDYAQICCWALTCTLKEKKYSSSYCTF